MDCINEIRRQRPTTKAQKDLLERCANSLDALTRKIDAGEVDKKSFALRASDGNAGDGVPSTGRGRGRALARGRRGRR